MKHFLAILQYKNNELRQVNYLSNYLYERNVIDYLNTISGTRTAEHKKLLIDRIIYRSYHDGLISTPNATRLRLFVQNCYNNYFVRRFPMVYRIILRIIGKNIERYKRNAYKKPVNHAQEV